MIGKEIERAIANKIADQWYNEIHGKTAPIFSKQKLRDFVEAEFKKLHISQNVSNQRELLLAFELYLYDEYDENIVSGAIDEFIKYINKNIYCTCKIPITSGNTSGICDICELKLNKL